MDLSRPVYSRDLKITVMRALDAGAKACRSGAEVQLSPKTLEGWRSEWRAQGELAFPGIGRRKIDMPAEDDTRRVMELERKIGQLTMENDFLIKALQREVQITNLKALNEYSEGRLERNMAVHIGLLVIDSAHIQETFSHLRDDNIRAGAERGHSGIPYP